jgi:NADH-quinone oxidoreductase subunit E
MDTTESSAKLAGIAERYKSGRSSLIAVLQEISQEFGYLPEEALREVSGRIEVPISLFYSLATFYKSFRLQPIGKKHICVCVGTACHVRGADKVVDTLERELGIQQGDTTADGGYTLDTVNCLGACALGPLVTVNGVYHGKMDQIKVARLLKAVRQETPAENES